MFSRKKDENNSLYEYYARKNGLQGKSLLILSCLYYTKNEITQNTICENENDKIRMYSFDKIKMYK